MATIVVQNNSGRSLDSVMVWHNGDLPPSDVTPSNAALSATNVASGASPTAGVSVDDTIDWWALGVLFHGDGTPYVMCGDTSSPYFEYTIDEDHTVTFVINTYSSSGPEQPPLNVFDNGDSEQHPFLISSSFLQDIELAGIIAHILEA